MANSEPTIKDWASAIALRISDEWNGKSEWPEDAELMRECLEEALAERPDLCRKMIGTGIIETDYFEPLEP